MKQQVISDRMPLCNRQLSQQCSFRMHMLQPNDLPKPSEDADPADPPVILSSSLISSSPNSAHMLATLSSNTAGNNLAEWGQVDKYWLGELWVRVGMDGVPLWKSQVVSMGTNVSACGKMVNMGEHSPTRHFVCSIYRGNDSCETLCDVFNCINVPANIRTHDAIVQYLLNHTLFGVLCVKRNATGNKQKLLSVNKAVNGCKQKSC